MENWLPQIGRVRSGDSRATISDIPTEYSEKLAPDFQLDYDVRAWTIKELQSWAKSNGVKISPDMYAAIQSLSAFGNCFLLMFYPDKSASSWSGEPPVEVLQLSTDDAMFHAIASNCPRGFNYCSVTRMVAE